MTTRVYTCIICPSGCEITVEHDNGKVISVTGNTCKRGEKYVINELTSPTRTLTTTVMTYSGIPVPVKTSAPVPKSKLAECMKAANTVKAADNVKAGDMIIENICDTGANLTATNGISR